MFFDRNEEQVLINAIGYYAYLLVPPKNPVLDISALPGAAVGVGSAAST